MRADGNNRKFFLLVSVYVLTETMSSGLSLGDSGFGTFSGNMSPRALRASRDMEPPCGEDRRYCYRGFGE